MLLRETALGVPAGAFPGGSGVKGRVRRVDRIAPDLSVSPGAG